MPMKWAGHVGLKGRL